jgi:hypothetical protein
MQLALPEKLTFVHLFKKFPTFCQKGKAHHRTHKMPPLAPILRHNINFNNILQSTGWAQIFRTKY